jgi:hypothetical protein
MSDGIELKYGGPGLITLLTCIFVVAKLWGKIDWSWWWVFSPLWIGAIVTCFILIIVLIIVAVVWLWGDY